MGRMVETKKEGRGGEPMTREKIEREVWIVALIPQRD